MVLNVNCKIVKHLEDNTGENLDGLKCVKNFLDTTSRVQSIKEIIDKLDFIKIKTSALRKKVSRADVWPRGQSRKTLSLPPPRGTAKLNLFIEQLSL